MTDKPTYEELELRVKELEFLELHKKKDENKLSKFFNISIDMLCIADLKGYFKIVNDPFLKNLGYSKKELYDNPFFYFVHPDDLDSTKKAVATLKQGEPIVYFENRYRCKDGSYKWLAWTSMPTVDENITYAVARDITDIKQIEDGLKKKLKDKYQDLEHTIKTLKVLVAEREKERNTIEERVIYKLVNLVGPYFNKLSEICTQPEQKEYLQIIKTSLEKVRLGLSENISLSFPNLTPTESQIANLIKFGKSTKEIAKIKSISVSSVDFHRKNQ